MESEPLYESAHYRVDSPDQDGPEEGGYLFLFGREVDTEGN